MKAKAEELLKAVLVLSHLTCDQVGLDEDPPQMFPEQDNAHGEVMKFTCPMCHHKVTLDLLVSSGKAS